MHKDGGFALDDEATTSAGVSNATVAPFTNPVAIVKARRKSHAFAKGQNKEV